MQNQQVTKLRQMEELDARIEKVSYDLSGLEYRKKELEDEKTEKQKQIEKLEKEKSSILAKTDHMKGLQKFVYIVVTLKTDLKKVELINARISEHKQVKDHIQNKIDIQNSIYADTIKEKDSYIEQRKELYTSNEVVSKKEETKSNDKVSQINAFMQIYDIAKQYKDNKIMNDLSKLVEKEIDHYLKAESTKKVSTEQNEEQDEME